MKKHSSTCTKDTDLLVSQIMSIFSFLLWYFPMGLYRNARESGAEHSRGATVFAFIWVFFVFTTSFSFFIIAGMDSVDMAGGIIGLLTVLMFSFCGQVSPSSKHSSLSN